MMAITPFDGVRMVDSTLSQTLLTRSLENCESVLKISVKVPRRTTSTKASPAVESS